MPLRLRLTLVTTALMAIVFALMGLFLSSRFEAGLDYALEKGLRSRAQSIVDALDRGDARPAGEGELIETDEAFTQILSRDGRIVASSAGIERLPLIGPRALDLEQTRLVESNVRTVEDETPDTPSLLLIVPADDRIVIVGASREDELEALAALRMNLLTGGAAGLVASALIGWVVAGFALRPVERMRAEAAAISADDTATLIVPKTRDELQRLGMTLNDMIARMREAIAHERRFVDDASHELRTPLSVLRTELDVALRRARTVGELEATVRSALEETERLQGLAEDLLLLARADGAIPIRREQVTVADMVRTAAAAYGAIDIDVPDDLVASVDAARLRQALDNLLTNARRHTPTDGRIAIAAESHYGTLEVTVTDTGPGFSEEFLPRAFDAFARSDDGRGRDDGGTGLGLAIVKAIAQAHGGTVEAANRTEGGARVTLRLPG